jgi:hypothetical protein
MEWVVSDQTFEAIRAGVRSGRVRLTIEKNARAILDGRDTLDESGVLPVIRKTAAVMLSALPR